MKSVSDRLVTTPVSCNLNKPVSISLWWQWW